MILEKKISIIGLGYVGLPLAVEFANKGFAVVGYDINVTRVQELKGHYDLTNEVSEEDLKKVDNLNFTSNGEDIKDSDIYIVTVPTPIDSSKQPDLSPLKGASELIGKCLSKDNIVYTNLLFIQDVRKKNVFLF